MHFSPSLASVAGHRDHRLDRRAQPSGELPTRILDIVVALVLLIFLAPLMLTVAAAILVFDRGPIIFAHRRLGRDGRSFACLKFRTMVPDSDRKLAQLLSRDADARREWSRDFKLRRDPRITLLGSMLRQSSLDELPQLFNVLRGDMSIVGPRPIVEEEIELYGRFFRHYSKVKPGITGLRQLSDRSGISYRRRVAMDVCYARRKSIGLDLKILAMTVPAVLIGRGNW